MESLADPLFLNRYVIIIKYWLNVENTDNIILRTVYNQLKTNSDKGHKNWITDVKHLLDNHGFTYVFENISRRNTKTFIGQFKS